MNIMEAKNDITDISLEMDNLYGKVGTPEREQFRREAYAYCMGQIIHDARKTEKITQAELASRIGADKAYISKIEKGVVEPGVGMFYRIIDALGLRVEIVKSVY
jgi:DNA-binding XRE family transcriptional regulator